MSHSSALPNLSVVFVERDWIVSYFWESSNILYLVGSSSWFNNISLDVTYIHIPRIDNGEVLDFCSLCFGLVVALWINKNVDWIYSWWSSRFVPWLPTPEGTSKWVEEGNKFRYHSPHAGHLPIFCSSLFRIMVIKRKRRHLIHLNIEKIELKELHFGVLFHMAKLHFWESMLVVPNFHLCIGKCILGKFAFPKRWLWWKIGLRFW